MKMHFISVFYLLLLILIKVPREKAQLRLMNIHFIN